MEQIRPNRTFNLLLLLGFVFTAIILFSLVRIIVIGCSEGWHHLDLACLFFPEPGDLPTHLISYVIMILLLTGLFKTGAVLLKQVPEGGRITDLLVQLEIHDSKMERVFRELNIENARLIDHEDELCFCAGFISPRIYVSSGMVKALDMRELKALLYHEEYHRKNRDPLKMMLGKVTMSLCFFMPLLGVLYDRYCVEKELAADRYAVLNQTGRDGIAGALFKMLPARMASVEGAVAQSTDAIYQRILYLSEGERPGDFSGSLKSILALFVLFSFCLPIWFVSLPTHG